MEVASRRSNTWKYFLAPQQQNQVSSFHREESYGESNKLSWKYFVAPQQQIFLLSSTCRSNQPLLPLRTSHSDISAFEILVYYHVGWLRRPPACNILTWQRDDPSFFYRTTTSVGFVGHLRILCQILTVDLTNKNISCVSQNLYCWIHVRKRFSMILFYYLCGIWFIFIS